MEPPSADVRVPQVAFGSGRQKDGVLRIQEVLNVVRIRLAVRSGHHHPDALMLKVGEEQRAVVFGRIVVAVVVERDTGDRIATAAGTAVVSHDRSTVEILEQGAVGRSGAVEIRTEDVVERLVPGLGSIALDTWPAEVLGDRVTGVGYNVDLLPGVRSDVADVDLLGPGADRESERVAKPGGDDASRVRI